MPSPQDTSSLPVLGVVIVTFNATDIIFDCLESLLAATHVRLHIVIVDNGSTDGTAEALGQWAQGHADYVAAADLPIPVAASAKPVDLSVRDPEANRPTGHCLTLLETGVNLGFAGGVNAGLGHLAAFRDIDRFWILNPDSVTPPTTPSALACKAVGPRGFSLMGGRVIYLETPDKIQIDGGIIDWRTGVTHNKNQYLPPAKTPGPAPETLDFIMGGSMVASRAFIEAAGPMAEDYFLYYEEVDWAQRRKGLPLAWCQGAEIYHRAGSTIGSPAPGRPASAFSLYFKHRGRLRFLRRFRPWSLPGALAYSAAKSGQLLLKGYGAEAWAVLAGSLGLPPPRKVRARLSPGAARLAFGSN